MPKRFAFAAALLMTAAIMTGCSVDGAVTPTPAPELGVDIIVPYATTTPSPEATPEPVAMYITGDGEVVLNDEAVISGITGDEAAVSGRYTQLRLGDTGESVAAMQERLTELGYYSAGVSGVFDEATEEAVRLFERSYGTMQTGIATAAMQERLYSDTALVYNSDAYLAAVESTYVLLEPGDTGANVVALQVRLKELGYPITDVTGVYDEQTAEAVSLFYEVYGYKGRDYAIVDMQKVLYSPDAIVYVQNDNIDDPSLNALNLSKGQSGTRVTQLQLRLVELGYLSEANGEYDQATVDAVSNFQVACRVEPTGIADVDIQQQLFASDAPRYGEIKQLYGMLQWGDTGDAVRALQVRLGELGYYHGEADGVFSDDMVASVKQFQRSAGMEETGVATITLQELAFSENAPLSPEKAAQVREDEAAAKVIINPAIRGDENEGVRELQTRLIELGYLSGAADGKFGAATEQAVKDFQTAIGVEPTGEASSALINVIYSDAAPEKGRKYWKRTQYYKPLKIGDTGDDVVELQVRLYKLGYLNKDDVIDSVGVYEEYTAAAVNEVMKVLGFRRRDGSASTEFLTILYSDSADSLKK